MLGFSELSVPRGRGAVAVLAKLADASVDCFGQGCTWLDQPLRGRRFQIGVRVRLTCYLHLPPGAISGSTKQYKRPHSLTLFTDDHIGSGQTTVSPRSPCVGLLGLFFRLFPSFFSSFLLFFSFRSSFF